MSQEFRYYDLQLKNSSTNIEIVFPRWKHSDENLVIFSPHDDDVILGAGYILLAALRSGAKVYIIIFNDGSAGYSKIALKDEIISTRKLETLNALKILGIEKDKIIRFNIPDFSGIHYLGWKFPWKKEDNRESEGLFSKVISTLRKIKATRLVFPNGYREHIDHTAVYLSAMFDGPQVGDSVIIDYGEPSEIHTFLQYSVWSKFSPENSILKKQDTRIRANKAISVNKEMEDIISEALREFKTQKEIISNIMNVRKERKMEDSERFIELYLSIDPRPQFNYNPYKKLISEIDLK
ncbi:MAG: PIG-L family deacetylase [Promethearchaeota archaeon]|nr:MAG: PIG-L family deacetylase [Candidatus Lokiarchaeota archaeon]